MTISTDDARLLARGKGKVYSGSGDKIGSIGQVYLDDATGEPTWVTVKTGLFGLSESFVPLEGARVDGDDVHVGFGDDTVKRAPRVDPSGTLTPEEERELFRYYASGTPGAEEGSDGGGTGADGPIEPSDGRDVREVGVREVGRARLRRFVVTETVPVTHEEIRVEREPIDQAEIDDALSGHARSNDQATARSTDAGDAPPRPADNTDE